MHNNLPVNIWRNRIDMDGGEYIDTARGTFPDNLIKNWYPTACQHCTNPPCLPVCPVEATSIRDDGIVVVDNTLCIGCGSCVLACPYKARKVIESEVEYYTEHALGDYDAPKHISQTVEKCDFCIHRIDNGGMPACMEFCPSSARHWGDLDDPESDVSKYLQGKDTVRLLEEISTEPNCFYIV
jgi:molybdopterin-containing oxidoreductase family iron-sulfur binding subunit